MRTIIIKQNLNFCYERGHVGIKSTCHYFDIYYGGYRCLANGEACGSSDYIKLRLWNNCPFKEEKDVQ